MENREIKEPAQKDKKSGFGFYFLLFAGFIAALVGISQLVVWLMK